MQPTEENRSKEKRGGGGGELGAAKDLNVGRKFGVAKGWRKVCFSNRRLSEIVVKARSCLLKFVHFSLLGRELKYSLRDRWPDSTE